jgi:hypothetical protein
MNYKRLSSIYIQFFILKFRPLAHIPQNINVAAANLALLDCEREFLVNLSPHFE